jgi:uncharacterized Zn finger protein
MADSDLDLLQTALKRRWSWVPSKKAKGYVNAFFATERRGTKIIAKVVGNHGTYTVSIQGDAQGLRAACSCYIGKNGHCHHCEALAITFLDNPSAFKLIKTKQIQAVRHLTDVRAYLDSVTLEALLTQLKAKGITQKAFAEQIGMNTRHLGAMKSSELRNHFFNELGATKLACVWMLDHLGKTEGKTQ